MSVPHKFVNELDLRFVSKVTKTSLDMMKTKVTVAHLIDPLAKTVFALAMRAVAERGMYCPEIDLQALIDDAERIDRLKGFDYPFEITTVQALLEHIAAHTSESSLTSIENTIIERHVRMSMTRINNKFMIDLSDSTKTTKELLRSYCYSLDTLSMSNSSSRRVLSASDAMKQELDYINSPIEDVFPTTGIPPIDEINSGLNAPSLTILAGEGKSGKSSLLYNIIVDALKQDRVVLFGTIEIPSKEAMRKIICCYYNIDYNKVQKKLWESEDEKKEYLELVTNFEEMTRDKLIVMDDDEGMCAKDLETQCMILEKAGIIVQDIVVDYTLIMKSNNPRFIGNEGLSYIPAELRQLSKKTNTRVFSAAQLHTRGKNIEDITTEDIYYMKNLSHEITYLLFLKNVDDGKEFYMKFAPSRQLWDTRIYKFPNIDFDTLYLGEFDIVDSTTGKDSKRASEDYVVHDSSEDALEKYAW